MTLKVEGFGPSPADIEEPPKERVRLSPETQQEFEFLVRSIQEVLEREHKANEGNNGVIFKLKVVDQKGSGEFKEYAAKLLKVGDFATLQSEYENQFKAAEILRQAIEAGADPDDYAKIPVPDLCENVEANESLKKHLEEEGIKVSGDKVGVLLMDWINGEDIATHLFKEVLKLKDSKYLDRIAIGKYGQHDFNQLHAAAGYELEYEEAGGKAVRAGDKIFEQIQVERRNEEKLYKALKKGGYLFPKKTVEQIDNTIKLLEDNGLPLWDGHARNVMTDRQGNNPHLIDFAPQRNVIGAEASNLDSRALVRSLEYLTTTAEQDADRELMLKLSGFASEYNRYTRNTRWIERTVDAFKEPDEFLKEARHQIVGSVDKVDDFIFALLYKMKNNEISEEDGLEFLTDLSKRDLVHWRKEKIMLAIKKAKE